MNNEEQNITPLIEEDNKPNILRILILTVLGLFLLGIVFVGGIAAGIGLSSARAANTPLTGGEGVSPLPLPLPNSANDTPDAEADLDVFWEVWNTLENRFYYDMPTEEERIQGAITGMVNSLDDPYTAYVSPEVAAIMREDYTGDFEGIGAYVEESQLGGVHIIRVFEDSPAEKGGLRAGDVVVAVDGDDVTDQILNQTLLLIRGPAGTDVTLTVFREGEDEFLEITITRGRIEIPTIEVRMLEDNIGYVALFEFNAQSSARLESAVKDLMDQGAESLILDLRNNPGGFLDQSINIADQFLPSGLAMIQRSVDGSEIEHTTDNGDYAEDIPMVVLINGNSASASEIVAGALQDRGRATLIGETSFGKGSVQLLIDLSDGSQLRVTYSNWYTPNDNVINGVGVTPDILIELPEEPGDVDLYLERAIEYLLQLPTGEPVSDE